MKQLEKPQFEVKVSFLGVFKPKMLQFFLFFQQFLSFLLDQSTIEAGELIKVLCKT